jgi:tetratricopeptide (TPR) repeat protein
VGRAVLLSAIAQLLLLSPAVGQTAEDYLVLVAEYPQQPERSARSIAAWDGREIGRGVARCLRVIARSAERRQCSERQRIAAAMLHTDAAVLLARDRGRTVLHLEAAARLLEGVSVRASALDPFVHRWYEFATTLYLSRGYFGDAVRMADAGLRRFPDAARVVAARGLVAETRVLFNHGNIRGEPLIGGSSDYEVARQLTEASVRYRRALDLDPDLTYTRLRYGWVQLLIGDGRAVGELTRVVGSTRDPAVRYLAHLFVGAAAMRAGRLEEAIAAYQAARSAGPRFQTACLALSHAQAIAGRTHEARALAVECATQPRADDPWWPLRLGAGEPGLLAWLRQEAQRR